MAKVIPSPNDYAEGLALSAIENLQRRSLTAKDRSIAITELLKQLGTPLRVAKTLGLSESTIAKWLKFNELVPDEIKELVGNGITRDQALQLVVANYPDLARAIELAIILAKEKPTDYAKDRIIKRSRRDKNTSPKKIVEEETPKKDELSIKFHLIDEFAIGMKDASKELSAEENVNEAAKTIVEDYLQEEEFVKMD